MLSNKPIYSIHLLFRDWGLHELNGWQLLADVLVIEAEPFQLLDEALLANLFLSCILIIHSGLSDAS